MIEYALLRCGEIVNVVTGTREGAEAVARSSALVDAVVPLESLPLDVKRRYRYWAERP